MVLELLQLNHDAASAEEPSNVADATTYATLLRDVEWVRHYASIVDSYSEVPRNGGKLGVLMRVVATALDRIIPRGRLLYEQTTLAIAHADAFISSEMGRAMLDLGENETTASVIARWAMSASGTVGCKRGLEFALNRLGQSFAEASKSSNPLASGYIPLPPFSETLRSLTHYAAIWVSLLTKPTDLYGKEDPTRAFVPQHLYSGTLYSASHGALTIDQSRRLFFAINALPALPSVQDVEHAAATALATTDFPPTPQSTGQSISAYSPTQRFDDQVVTNLANRTTHLALSSPHALSVGGGGDDDYTPIGDASVSDAIPITAVLSLVPSTPAAAVGRGQGLRRSRR